MDADAVLVEVSIKPHPLAAWFHRPLTVPVVEVDGHAYTGPWGTRELTVSAGRHRISAYFRYRGQSAARLAETEKEFSVAATTPRVRFAIRLGLRNGSPFAIKGPVGDPPGRAPCSDAEAL
ncbi:hypothetical protein [Streptomyces sp. 8L]|uniref:hypothetical protein n=1 Tax=Streptomyces sp. 8L TaxID=2877242 RepID=UPI001CD6F88F|nr:hypothetical protein [Streptomyces sp. 8L]MCA1223652.1 hypothetical protein [Streptomyces sp. 8L]